MKARRSASVRRAQLDYVAGSIGGSGAGVWPDDVPPHKRSEYDRTAIRHWLAVFLKRFFELSQFKRSALPNAPKVGSGGSLSPRSDWRAPSDGHADAWLQELERDVPGEPG